MTKTEFLTIFCTYSNFDVVKQTLPSVIEETKSHGNSRLIVHDSTEVRHGQEEKWSWLRQQAEEHGFFLLLSTNLSMAHARNMCLHLGQELYCPDYVAMMEDDFGYKPGLIDEMIKAMDQYYGQPAPNGLLYGLFTGYGDEDKIEEEFVEGTKHKYRPIQEDSRINRVGGTNSSYRCAPTSHWNNVLKGYDTDEYLISTFQTNNLNLRNYHKGFTVLSVQDSQYMFTVENEGRGTSQTQGTPLWDPKYTASDYRSQAHLNKKVSKSIPSKIIKKLFKK